MGELDPGPSGLGLDPEKGGVSAKSISSQGFWAGGLCHAFSESGRGKKNVGSGILIFTLQPEKMGPRRLSWLRGGNLKLGISTFLIKEFMQLFDLTHPEGPRGVGENQKIKLGYFL